MNEEDALERRIAELSWLTAQDPAVLAAEKAFESARVDYIRAQGTDAEDEHEDRYLQLLAEHNRIVQSTSQRPWDEVVKLLDELRSSRVRLAELRAEPHLVHVEVERRVLLDGGDGRLVELRPYLSGSGELLLQIEFGPPAVAFVATLWSHSPEPPEDVGLVLVTFGSANPLPLWGVSQLKFGYPNEEALMGNPLIGVGFDGIGFYEMVNSRWPAEIVAMNRHRFPETPDDVGLRHFMLAFKEHTLEVLAADYLVERIPTSTWDEAISRYRERTPSWGPTSQV